MKLNGSVAAIVTGGASGLGEATAQALAESNARVSIFDIDEKRGAAVANQLGCQFYICDVTSKKSTIAAYRSAREANGSERILVNCAGGGSIAPTISRDPETNEVTYADCESFDQQTVQPCSYLSLLVDERRRNGETGAC